MRHARQVFVLLALSLTGCATAPQGADPADADAPRWANCFRISTVDNWRVIDNRSLIVFAAGRNNAFHVRLFSSCTGVNFTEVMGFRARGSQFICGDPGDEILFRDNRCAISSVRAISPAEAEALRSERIREDIGRDPALDAGTGEKEK